MDKYTIGEVIGGGVNGDVHMVYRDGEKYAMKTMDLMCGPHPHIYGLNEVSILSSLHHPNIGRIEEVIIDDVIRVIMPYYGKDVSEATLTREDVRMVMWKMVNTLLYLHKRGVIHRDIKPTNILVDERKEPTLIDFGISSIDGTDLDNSEVVTLYWRHPSLIDGMSSYDIRIDIWALGVTMYNMLTGDLLWRGDGPYAYRDIAMKTLEDGLLPSILERNGIYGDERDFILQILTRRYEDIPMFGDLISSPYFQGLSYPIYKGPSRVVKDIRVGWIDKRDLRMVKGIMREVSQRIDGGGVDIVAESLLLLYRVNERVREGNIGPNDLSIVGGDNIPSGHLILMAIACVEIICTGYRQVYIDDRVVVIDTPLLAKYVHFICDILKCCVHPFAA